jgi:hypothetical protein
MDETTFIVTISKLQCCLDSGGRAQNRRSQNHRVRNISTWRILATSKTLVFYRFEPVLGLNQPLLSSGAIRPAILLAFSHLDFMSLAAPRSVSVSGLWSLHLPSSSNSLRDDP